MEACKARADARDLYDARREMVRGLAALRGEALAATPRELSVGRGVRVAQGEAMGRLRRGQLARGGAG